jgi:predicted PurR-regulated permease PerM
VSTKASPLWRAIWIAVALTIFGLLLIQLRAVLTPVLFALLLAYVLDPLVDRFEALRLPRALGIVVLLVVALAALSLFVVLVVPALVRDVTALVRALTEGLLRFIATAQPWLQERGIPVPNTLAAALDNLGDSAVSMASSALAPAGEMVVAAIGGTASALGMLSTAIVVPVFSFYFLHDFDRIVLHVRELLPASVRPGVVAMATQVDRVLGEFIRGQLTVMAILAALYALGYWAIGVPLAVPIGVLAGVLSFIPYVGSSVALVFGLLMVTLHFTGVHQILGVIAVYLVIQLLESFLITPRIVGGKLGLSPVWVLFALMAFGHLFGFVGVMLALPASAVIKVFVVDALTFYRGSTLYLGSPGQGASARVRPARLRLRPRRSIRVRGLAPRGGSR